MSNWQISFHDKKFRIDFVVSVLLLTLILIIFFFILAYIEKRNGYVIEKGWMDNICSPKDLSAFIFPLTWPVAFIGVIICARDPRTMLVLIRAYAILILLRGITLLSVPLDPPNGMIPLNDPFLHSTFYNGRTNLKDLFFSGHVSTILLFVFILENKWLKTIFMLIALALASLIAIQRVHYITDIVFAIPFAWIACMIAKKWTRKTLVV